jgi:hypothetical protein
MGLIRLYRNGIYNDELTIHVVQMLLDLTKSHPMSSELYCKMFGFLAVIVGQHTSNHKDMLLNKQLQQLMQAIVRQYLEFRAGYDMTELDRVFLPNNVGYFLSVLQYLLVYSEDTSEVIGQAVKFAQL